jgi:catechol 2,3-dioxygenase-like lactoylglutathione lyase family enzyme
MTLRVKTVLLALPLLLAAAVLPARAADAPAAGAAVVKPQFLQGSMNVYRRYAAEDHAKMVDFYDKALGLKPLQPIKLSAAQQIVLFGVGSGQIKLAAGVKQDRQYHTGGVKDFRGIRLYTLFFSDEAALTARFAAAGYPAPAFKDIGGGKRAAVTKDPAGFNLELVIEPGAPPEATGRVEVGINVSDLNRSRAFYRDFVGLEELPPVKDPILGLTKYPFRHGQTSINLWSVGHDLPADTGSAGIQYVISNVEAMNARALAEHVTVETPLGGVPGFQVLTVWLNDPDGVTDYFYQFTGQRAAAK